jgi:hypothetical protein
LAAAPPVIYIISTQTEEIRMQVKKKAAKKTVPELKKVTMDDRIKNNVKA